MKSNNKILIWTIIILAVTNISTVGTIIYHNYFQQNTIDCNEEKTNKIEVPDTRLGKFFREELNLSYEQHQQFRTFRQNFHYKAGNITQKMQMLRNDMLTELKKENSDTVYLHKLAKEIGNLHTELKHLTFEYYLDMKSVCNDDQKEKLYQIFNSMMNKNAEIKMPKKHPQNFHNMNLRKLN